MVEITMTDDQKVKIDEEESYRAQVRDKLKKKKGIGCLGVSLIVLVLILLICIPIWINQSNTGPVPVEPITEDYKKSLAIQFCDNRSDGKRYVSLEPYVNKASSHEYTTQKPTSESCKAAAEFCLKSWDKEECEGIANKKIWIGMTGYQLAISWGYPRDINKTVVASGVHSQYVYGDFGPYVYLEGKTDNLTEMVVTSWQD